MRRIISIVVLLLSYVLNGIGNNSLSYSPDSISAYFARQSILFPQEKIHVQTDKPHYMAGDTVWFRAYLVDGCTHTASAASNFVYADLINPRGELVERIKILNDRGVYAGQLELPAGLPVGNYRLSFYTRYMHEEQPDYLFTKKLPVESYFSTRYQVEALFSSGEKAGKWIAHLSFKEFGKTDQQVPDRVRFTDRKGELREVRAGSDGRFHFELKGEDLKNDHLYFQYTIGSNTQKQYVYIPPLRKDYDVAFFPEGGLLPGNTLTRIAFKALNNEGLGEDVKGVVVNSQGDTVAVDIESGHLGMGTFSLMCDPKQSYRMICRNRNGVKKEYVLPSVTPGALSLRADRWRDNVNIYLVRDSSERLTEPLYLTLQCRGKVVYSRKWENPSSFLRFPGDSLPTGVIQAILTNADNLPLSERLFFNISHADATTVKFKTNKKSYDRREQVKATVEVLDDKKQPLASTLSVSVTDNGFVTSDTCQNILSTLLLTSDLKGYIESPAYYFTGSDPNKVDHLDFLMLTQGWSRYDVNGILAGKMKTPSSKPEISQEIRGILYRGLNLNKPADNYLVTLFVPESGSLVQASTDADGRFCFSNLLFQDSTQFVLQGNTRKKHPDVEIELQKDSLSVLASSIPDGIRPPQKDWYQAEIVKKAKLLSEGDVARTYQLDEVEVTARYIRKEDVSMYKGTYSSEFNQRASGKELIERYHPSSVMDMLQYVSGVAIWRAGIVSRGGVVIYPYIPSETGSLFPPPPAYILIDNMPASANELSALMPQYIAGIEVIKGGRVAILGPKGGAGGILITTSMRPVDQEVVSPTNIQTITSLGYQVRKEFYSPKYETKVSENTPRTDNRATLYWNPDIRTQSNGLGEFQFYTSDLKSTYQVVLEGLSEDGRLIHWQGEIIKHTK